MYFDTSKLPFTEHYTVSASSSKTGIKLFPLVSSLLCSRFFGMSHNTPPFLGGALRDIPKKMAAKETNASPNHRKN